MSVADFHAAFEAHRAEVAPPDVLHHIRGVVLDPTGAAATGTWVGANGGAVHWEDTTLTAADGSFELAVRDGHYALDFDATISDYLIPTDQRINLGASVSVDGADITGIEIRLPDGSSCAAS